MTNESNNDNFKNKLTKELKEKIQKSVNDSFEKNVQGKSGTENAGMRDFERRVADDFRRSADEGKDRYDGIKKRGNEEVNKKKEEFRKHASMERDKHLQKQGALGDFNELRRLDSMPRASQEEQIREIKKEVQEEAKKETKRASKYAKSRKARIMLTLSGEHLDKLAFVISQKMTEQAKSGGVGAMFSIALTYLLALAKDLFDYTGVGAIVGILTGILVGAIIAMFWVQVVGGWKGGLMQKILIKKIIVKIGIAAFIETLPGPNFIPTFVIMNLWSHLDYIRMKMKAKSDLESFHAEYKTNKSIIKDYYGKYIGS